MASVSTMDTFPRKVGLNDPDALHALGAQAVRTDPGGAGGTAIVDPDGLQVRQPAALGLIHCVANVVARHRTLATNVASLGHNRRIVSCRAPFYNPLARRQGKQARARPI